jgi:hypothetical protein
MHIMPKNSFKLISFFALAAAFVLNAPIAFAELGGAVAKEAVQVQELSPVVATEQHLNVFQVSAPSGTVVKEYTDANHVVVAVSWQGPTLPNLRQLLGEHFDTFVNRPAHTGSPRSAELVTDDLVVQSQGHMRNFSGRAYLPKMLPAGFNVNQIK